MQESENRGVTAYRGPAAPCHLSASARPSAYARSGSVNRSSRRIRSESTRPLVTRSPTRSASVEQRVHGGREVRPEDQRGGGAGAREAVDEVGGDPGGVRRVGQARLLGQRAAFEPVEQGHAEAADRAHLRVVHVGVDEPREHQPVAEVDDLVVRVLAEELVGRSAGDDHAVADEQRRVGLRAQVVALERALRGVDEGAAEERHR